MYRNPIIWADDPDLDVIRVNDTYYMVSTTMHMMPGCVILRSYDLIHWETAVHVYDVLDGTPAHRLEGGRHIYGQGMWAGSLRFHKGKFYVVFAANDTHRTYLYTAVDIGGPWTKQYIDGFYHDCSLLFDDDDSAYLIYGNTDIYLTELEDDLSGPKPGGLHRIVVREKQEHHLGYEGAHLYQIDGRYYAFFIHIAKANGRRTQACYAADSLEGEFVGGDVFNDDIPPSSPAARPNSRIFNTTCWSGCRNAAAGSSRISMRTAICCYENSIIAVHNDVELAFDTSCSLENLDGNGSMGTKLRHSDGAVGILRQGHHNGRRHRTWRCTAERKKGI